MTLATPTQELAAKDLHGYEWRFKHIFRGKPLMDVCIATVVLLNNDSLFFDSFYDLLCSSVFA